MDCACDPGIDLSFKLTLNTCFGNGLDVYKHVSFTLNMLNFRQHMGHWRNNAK
jgi:hypothetical protein